MEFPRKGVPELLDNSEPLIFQITDWYIPENDRSRQKNKYDEEQDLYTMLIYGTTDNGETVSVNIVDYEPYFYVKAPIEWDDLSYSQYKKRVDKLNIELKNEKYEAKFKDKTYTQKIIPKQYEDHFNDLTIVKKNEFWGFTNNKLFNYIKVSVKSLALFNKLKYYFQSRKKDGFKLYESNIYPFLRYIHETNIKPAGWVKIDEYELNDNQTRCDYNIEINYKNIKPLNINKIAPLLIASFDIECTSSHGDFPVAKKDYKKVAQDLALVARSGYEIDKEFLTYWLQCIYSTDIKIEDNLIINKVYPKKKVDYKIIPNLIEKNIDDMLKIIEEISETEEDDLDDIDNEEKKKLTIGEINKLEDRLNKLLNECLPSLEGDEIIQIGTTVHKYGSDEIIYRNIISLNTCDPIENCDIIECKTEKKLIKEWKRIITELNPDILIGYNIFGFDMDYVWTRAIELGIEDDFKLGLGRKINRNNSLYKQELSSSALGENILKYFDMDGLILIDLFKVMQSGHKLDSYKLDNVASIFLGDKKDDLKPKELFEKYKGNSSDRCVIAKYCIQDCALVNRLLHKLKILENNIGMANVCLVPLNFLFRRGQGIKIFSLIAKQCMDKGLVIPVINNYDNLDIDTGGYEGAVVLDPIEGMYLNDPIVVFDYGSLYPSSMIARDLSHDRYILDDKYIIDDPNINYIDVSYDLYEGVGDKKKKVGIKTCKFAQVFDENGKQKRGIIAEILMMLLSERKNTRKKIEYETIYTNNNSYIGFVTEDDENVNILDIDTNNKIKINKKDIIKKEQTYSKFEQDVFDALQLAYKVTANSLYGQIGARTSPIYLKEIAACTTATGREMIMTAKKFVEDNYNAEVIYGDTDSIFCKFPLKDSNSNPVYGKQALKYAIETGIKVEKEIAEIMPYPQKLNYEKSLYPFIILSKKRYVGNLYEFDINKFKQKSMGIVLKRRDNANIVKKIYGGIIDILLNKQDLNASIEFLNDELNDLVNGKSNINDLIISKSLRASYKDPSKIAHKVLADRIGSRDPGNKPAVNDRVPYVYIKLDKIDKTTLQGDRIENPEYIVENSLIPDYLHYITNQIMKPVLQLYALSLEELPNYNKESYYWEKINEELKLKPIYIDDIKRKNRIENLRLQLVKELLFDKYIDQLSKPKIKKTTKKTSRILSSEITEKEEKTNNCEILKEDTIINLLKSKESLVDLKVSAPQNAPKQTIEVRCKVIIDKKTILDNKNICISNKNKEITNSIITLIDYFENNNIEKVINIKLNNKPFIKSYKKTVLDYKEFEKNENLDNNLVQDAINTNDIGRMKSAISVLEYGKLLMKNHKFSFIE
jgi:DNA polymerase delta subunit 1